MTNSMDNIQSRTEVEFSAENGPKIQIKNQFKESSCLTKEEVMKYKTDPFWVGIRLALFILFVLTLISMVVASICIVIFTPKCSQPLKWWQKTLIYQIDVRAFKDSSSDGEGDISGIIDKLDYIQNTLGLDALLLYPFFPTPTKSSIGFEITDHKEIDKRFGNLRDFEDLVKKLHKRNMKILIDFIPNHTSDEHLWFIKSKDKMEEYSDYYIWTDKVNASIDSDSNWSLNANRQQYYFHDSKSSQPNLNLNNHKVRQEIKSVLEFWLKKRVDGFRINLSSLDKLKDSNFTLWDNIELVEEWRRVVNRFGTEKCLLLNLKEHNQDLIKYYGSRNKPLVDLSFNDKLLINSFTESLNGEQVKHIIESTTNFNKSSNSSSIPWYTWVTGSHDVRRLATRIGHNLVDAIHMVAFLCPKSTPIVYYGDELGIDDDLEVSAARVSAARISANDYYQEQISYGSVMQWTPNSSTAGLSDSESVKPWLRVHPHFKEYNVETELKTNHSSHIKVFKALIEFRRKYSDAVLFGETMFPFVNNSEVFVMTRIGSDLNGFLLAINFHHSFAVNVMLNETYLPETGTIRLISSQVAESTLMHYNRVNHGINLTNFHINSLQSILVEFSSG